MRFAQRPALGRHRLDQTMPAALEIPEAAGNEMVDQAANLAGRIADRDLSRLYRTARDVDPRSIRMQHADDRTATGQLIAIREDAAATNAKKKKQDCADAKKGPRISQPRPMTALGRSCRSARRSSAARGRGEVRAFAAKRIL